MVKHPLRVAGIHLGTRMTVVRLEGRRLMLHSPVPIDDGLAEELSSLGEVGWLVAPSLFHHLFMGPASERFPEALVLAAPGLGKKRKDLRIDAEIDAAALPFPGMDACFVGGMPKANETVFLHRASGTLIVTDMLFNVVSPQGLWSRMMLAMMGASGGPRNSRYLKGLVKDRAAHRAALQTVLDWEFDRVIMCHGDVIESDGKAALRTGAAWNLPSDEQTAAAAAGGV